MASEMKVEQNTFALDEFIGKSGVYIISPNFIPNMDHERILVKIGMSRANREDENGNIVPSYQYKKGLYSRLDSYLLCYPEGFTLFAVIQTTYQAAYALEKLIQTYLAGKNMKTNFYHSHNEEWYDMTYHDIQTLLHVIHSNGKGIVKYVIYNPPKLVYQTGRSSNRPIRGMSGEERKYVESRLQHDQPIIQTVKKRKLNAISRSEDLANSQASRKLF